MIENQVAHLLNAIQEDLYSKGDDILTLSKLATLIERSFRIRDEELEILIQKREDFMTAMRNIETMIWGRPLDKVYGKPPKLKVIKKNDGKN